MSQLQIIRKNIENLISYLEPFLGLANCHMVDYFSYQAYTNFIPEDIRQDISTVGTNETINLVFKNDLDRQPNLQNYINNTKKYRPQNCKDVCLNIESFYEKLSEFGGENIKPIKLDIFMTSKKSHEVEILSNIAAAVQKIANTSHAIDIGDGKGYLSSMLALHYKIPVLGVDASEINTNSAVNRVEKLAKVWNSVTTGEKTKQTSKNLYRQITKFVDENIDFNGLIETIFLEKPTDISLVGLHTCGNLATASLKIFAACPDIKTICNVGCCYHFITEQFEDDPNILHRNKTADYGFPMSEFLKEKQFKLGRSARMIAAQSVDRIFYNKELPSKSIFFRALLEVFMKKYYPETPVKDVGRFRKPCTDFKDYTRKALKRLNIELQLSDEKIDDFYLEYKHRSDELSIFYLIRCMLAPVVENLILLDRLLFLHENGYEKSFLVQLFDPVISPRCCGIIAFK